MQGEQPTAANIEELLKECAANAPAQFRDQRIAWGFTEAGRLLTEARKQAFGNVAYAALEEMYASDDCDQAWLAITFLPLARLVALGLSTRSTAGWHEDAEAGWRAKLGQAATLGLVPYATSMRAERDKPSGATFVGAIVRHDRAWFWQNLTHVLDTTPQKAKTTLLLALADFSPTEMTQLQAELAQPPVAVDEALRKTLADGVTQLIAYNATQPAKSP